MAKSLAELLEEMNSRLARSRRHPCRGLVQASRYDGHNCHLVVDCNCQELDNEDAPQTIHAKTPEEG